MVERGHFYCGLTLHGKRLTPDRITSILIKMITKKKLQILIAAVLAVGGGLTLGQASLEKLPRVKESLLLNRTDGLLTEDYARSVIRNAKSLIVKSHEVKSSEWLEKLAKYYGTHGNYLRSTNNLEDPILRAHQQVIVYNKKGMVYFAQGGEPVEEIIKTYERLGGKKNQILAANAWDEISEMHQGVLVLRPGDRLWVPFAQKSYPILFRPVAWSKISSGFGYRRHPILKNKRFHDGFDMVASYGALVRASEAGVVTFAGWKGNFGNMVEIRHRNTTTLYGHLSKIKVQVGNKVTRKQVIGNVGSTGLSTGPHLHFQVRRNSDGKIQNPRKYLF